MILVWGFIAAALACMLLIVSLNMVTYPRLESGTPVQQPFVSILIPARNEAERIGNTLVALTKQKYENFEVIVLDDRSTDDTARIVSDIIREDNRIKFVSGAELPEGWLGKNWACHQLAHLADGEMLVFTDADVSWTPDALSAMLHAYQRYDAGLLTVWPQQIVSSWAERIVIPLMNFSVLAYLPEWAVRHTHSPVFSAANGQCLVFDQAIYTNIGGHEAVRTEVLDDMSLARVTKQKGHTLVMARSNGFIHTRMYTSWQEILKGFGKNILAGHAHHIPFLILSTIFHLLVFVFPFIYFFTGFSIDLQFWPWLPTLLIGGIYGLRALAVLIEGGEGLRDIFWMPVGVLLMSVIAVFSIWQHLTGKGVQWKGREVSRGNSTF